MIEYGGRAEILERFRINAHRTSNKTVGVILLTVNSMNNYFRIVDAALRSMDTRPLCAGSMWAP
jgi:hypothetical protein